MILVEPHCLLRFSGVRCFRYMLSEPVHIIARTPFVQPYVGPALEVNTSIRISPQISEVYGFTRRNPNTTNSVGSRRARVTNTVYCDEDMIITCGLWPIRSDFGQLQVR